VLETNIVVLHDQTPQISLPHPPLLRSRRHSRHDEMLLFAFFISTLKQLVLLLLLSLLVSLILTIVFSKKKTAVLPKIFILVKRQIQHHMHHMHMHYYYY
jgi:hypothetical protein